MSAFMKVAIDALFFDPLREAVPPTRRLWHLLTHALAWRFLNPHRMSAARLHAAGHKHFSANSQVIHREQTACLRQAPQKGLYGELLSVGGGAVGDGGVYARSRESVLLINPAHITTVIN